MKLRRATSIVLVFVFALGACAVVACQGDLPVPGKCTDIPAGGCPRADGACADPSCAALYVCTSASEWRFDSACPARDAAVDAPHVSVVDAAAIRDVSVDVPGASGGPGCDPLDAPDCPLATAAACGASCCGCEDLFVCESGGWTLWGACVDGEIRQNGADAR